MDSFLTLDEIIVLVNSHIISLNGDLNEQYIYKYGYALNIQYFQCREN